PHILVTTPESLYLLLTSQAREVLRGVEWVIVDEIHSMAATKRGAHLALTLERLEEVTAVSPQRIGLSATQRPLERIANFLGGGTLGPGGWEPRPVRVVDAPRDKQLDVEIVVPLEDMTAPDTTDDAGHPTRSIWPSLYPALLEQLMAHRSTIVFSNSRGIVERLAGALNDLAATEIARAHHGSLSREQRLIIEDALKSGELRCVVATSTLELGIDMDAVDLVILVESPGTVARGLQRVGRAGHQVGAPSRAKVFPKHRGDLLEATVLVDLMHQGRIEETVVPENPLDVLAQQVVAAVAVADHQAAALFDVVRRAYPFRSLPESLWRAVLDMLAGRYPSDDFAELRPRLVWDRTTDTLSARGNARLLAVTNAGTIPDRGLYPAVLPEGGRVGELDEEWVYESRVGDVFVLGSSSWKLIEITPDRIVVAPAPGERAARMPFWHGDGPGRPVETGRAVGAFVRAIAGLDDTAAREALTGRYHLDRRAADNLIAYLAAEVAATGTLPTDRTIVVERYRDEIGDWRLVVLSPFGSRVHAPWALALQRRWRDAHGVATEAIWSDDGIIVRFPDSDTAPDPMTVILDPDEVERLVVDEVGTSTLFAGRFREAAGRSLLLPRRRPGRRTPLWLQRRRAESLLGVVTRHPTFPIVLETYREILQEHFDLPALKTLLGDVTARKIRVSAVDTHGPSPFATSLSLDFVASFMYDYDAPPAERRAMALTVDQNLLRELLGEPAMRELLEPEAIAAVEAELQWLAADRKASGADGTADLLRSLGPLSSAAVAARSLDPDPAATLADLERTRRIVRVTMHGESRWAAVEDAGRLRDGLGVALPQGIPAAHLEPGDEPVADLVARFARTHGPFTVDQAAAELGLPRGVVAAALADLEGRGKTLRGALRPGGGDTEWVATEVLARMRRRSLAILRHSIEAVDAAAFSRFAIGWHGIGGRGTGPGRLIESIERLQGAAIPASILEADLLASRLDYSPDLLDTLTASGDVVWVGRGALGGRDGRVALYLRPRVPALLWDAGLDHPQGPVHDRLRGHLAERGASFFRDLYVTAGGGDPEDVLAALWDLVWAGEVTNDTIAPLRAFLWGRVRKPVGRRPTLPGAAAPPTGSGRWYLVADLMTPVDAVAAAAGRVEQLLARHGILVRDAVLGEGLPGGFAGAYPVLSAMEDVGRVRRGYFVEGLGGSQFALPGAVERLRGGAADAMVTVLAAADPANPYGAAISWPEHASRPGRAAGAYVVLIDGRLTAFVDRGGRSVLTFTEDPDAITASAAALTELARTRLRRMVVTTIDGADPAATALGRALLAAGFAASYRGLAAR
ncbi:MAG TPA: DEAD/DEAH box helicase, partial [Actinobacteria bacterium]|nr:DEAD/DEAH box helicase [Actinomycetota bacterium]